MTRHRKFLDGQTKTLFEGPEPGLLVQYFRDEILKPGTHEHTSIAGKGVLCNSISSILMSHLDNMGIDTHFIRRLNMREQVIIQADAIPLEVVVRNMAAGSFAERFGMETGARLPRSVVEYRWKNNALNCPLVAEDHIMGFGWASVEDLDDIMSMSIRINDYLSGLFLGLGIRLIDTRLQFGRIWEDDTLKLILIDEITPDSCRLQDISTGKNLDRDLYNPDGKALMDAYQDVARRLGTAGPA